MRYPYVAPVGTTLQLTASGTPQSINPSRSINANRILLTASAAGAYAGWGSGISSSNAFPIPAVAAGYLELWVSDPGDLFIVGSGTVYVLMERPEIGQ